MLSTSSCMFAGLDFRQAVEKVPYWRRARRRLTIDPGQRPAAEQEDERLRRTADRRHSARIGPVRGGTPAEQYLSSVRKIDTDAIADVLERTDAIGWHPSFCSARQATRSTAGGSAASSAS